MAGFEIEREAIIEITGTQYEGRADNHIGLQAGQKLKLKHMKDNIYDKNAVLVLTEDDKPLGFIPIGLAQNYAPAIDSGEYFFETVIVTTTLDMSRPILIVKINSTYKNLSEEEITQRVKYLLAGVMQGYEVNLHRYNAFITDESINENNVIECLNKLRFMKKIMDLSSDIIEENSITEVSEMTVFSVESITNELSVIENSTSELRKKFQKAFNESVDIEDDEEFERIQNSVRKKLKNVKSINKWAVSLKEYIADVSFKAESVNEEREEIQLQTQSEIQEENTSAFETDKKERLRQSYKQVQGEYQVVILNNPYDYTGTKPINFQLNDHLYSAGSWSFLYTRFLCVLNDMAEFSKVKQLYINKSLFDKENRPIDFANEKSKNILRRNCKIADDFYAEINLSTSNIIKRIKRIMELCDFSISDIEIRCTVAEIPEKREEKYVYEEVNYVNEKDIPDETDEQPFMTENPKPADTLAETMEEKKSEQELSENPFNINKTFNLAEAIVTILASENPIVKMERGYKGGLTPPSLQKLIKTLYNKNISGFDIGLELLNNTECLNVGANHFIIKPNQNDEHSNSDINTTTVQSDTSEPQNINENVAEAEQEFDLEGFIEDLLYKNRNDIYYQEGFDSYMIRRHIPGKYLKDISVKEIENVLKSNPKFEEIEFGYYVYAKQDEKSDDHTSTAEQEIPEENISLEISSEHADSDDEKITLTLNYRKYIALNSADAFEQICEFVIRVKPFEMAEIYTQSTNVNGKALFSRNPAKIDGYSRLSNGLQMLCVENFEQLKYVCEYVISYTGIDRNLIEISKV